MAGISTNHNFYITQKTDTDFLLGVDFLALHSVTRFQTVHLHLGHQIVQSVSLPLPPHRNLFHFQTKLHSLRKNTVLIEHADPLYGTSGTFLASLHVERADILSAQVQLISLTVS